MITLLLSIFFNSYAPEQRYNRKAETMTLCRALPFDFEHFKQLVKETCDEPFWVISQAILETGNFTSKNFLQNHNLFGMKYNKRGYAIGKGNNDYSIYNDWVSSLLDYAKWQDVKYKGGNYLAFLKRVGYAEDPRYAMKLKQIILTWD